jgi:ABC-type amino acid transport substrate-binding protein
MKITQLILVVILSLATAFATVKFLGGASETKHQETSYERVIRTGTLRCGYEYWDSGIMQDNKTNQLNGAWVDILNEFGKVAELKIEWTAHVGWGDVGAALKGGKIDAMCAGMWQSANKAKEMAFSVPILYQSIEPFVRADDHRFDGNVDRINSEDVTVAVIDADNSDFIAQTDFPKAKRVALSQLNGTDNDLFMTVGTKKADLTFDTPGLWQQYDKANPGQVRRVAPGHSLRVYGMSIVVDNDDPRLLNLINVGAQEIVNSGAVSRIVQKYDATYPDMYLKMVKPYGE